MKSKILIIVYVMALAICFIALTANCEPAEEYTEAYIICMPDDVVNVRSSPSTRSSPIGYREPGDIVLLDGKTKKGFYHCVHLALEDDEGWIHKGYVVFDEPILIKQNATIVSKGRLAARKYVGGKRTRWLKPLASVHVYYWSDEWCLTNCGYIQTRFLELEGE